MVQNKKSPKRNPKNIYIDLYVRKLEWFQKLISCHVFKILNNIICWLPASFFSPEDSDASNNFRMGPEEKKKTRETKHPQMLEK